MYAVFLPDQSRKEKIEELYSKIDYSCVVYADSTLGADV